MLYELLIAVLCVLIPVFSLFSFRWGVRFGMDKEKALNEPFIKMPKRKPKETKEQKKQRELLAKVDGYTGDK